uniref:Arrestin_C domain-containing protein n=1 Tax=Caenorhabditis tropicalis TaxID=1561998 RepID=A0A1I7TA03_9PELO
MSVVSRPTVLFDKPGKVYYPGETVTGTVVFENTEPLSARSVTIGSRGKTETWNVKTFDLNCKKPLFNGSELVWCSEDGTNKMPVGKQEFPFSFVLPQDCPPTFKGLYGQNKYKVVVRIDVPWKFTSRIYEEFTVGKKLDLPAKMWPSADKSTGWFYKAVIQAGVIFKEGPVTLKVSMPSLVVTPGETIFLYYNVTNNSGVPIKSICAKFCERSHFHCRHQHTPCKEFGFNTCPLGFFGQEFTTRKIGNLVSKTVNLAPFQSGTYLLPFTVPLDAKFPSFESGLMTHGYLFELGVRAENSWIGQYMTAKVYIGEQMSEEEIKEEEIKEIKEKSKEQEAFGSVPPPAYSP